MRPFILSAALAIILFSCSKSNDGGQQQVNSSFTWTFNGNGYTATLDSAFINYPLVPYMLIACIGTNFVTNHTTEIWFDLNSLNQGSYTITPGNNKLYYIHDNGDNYSGISGTLNITSNTNNRLSGNFSAITNGALGNIPVTGTFINVAVRQW